MMAFLIYLIQLWFLVGLIIFLHSIRNRVGLMPFLFMAVTLMVLLNFSMFINVRFRVLPDVNLGIAGHVFAPIILISLMIVYIADGDGLAQLGLAGLVGVNTLTLIMLSFVVLYLNLEVDNVIPPSTDASTVSVDAVFLRRRVASGVAFAGSMIIVAITYQFLRNLSRHIPEWLAISLALIVALWTDSFIFFVGSDLGIARFFNNLQNDLIGKSIASICVVIPFTLYMTQVVRKSPEYREVSGRSTFAILYGAGGRLQTALRNLESELQVSRQIYEELTQHIGEIFWLVDAAKEEIIYISPAFEDITGYRRLDYYRSFDMLQTIIHPDDRYTGPHLLEWLIEKESNEFRIIRADSQTRWMHNRTFSIVDADGKIYRYAGVMGDITEERKSREREFELAVAHERVQILRNFIRDASHDLKSPLSAILLKLDMLERHTDTARRQQVSNELRDRVMHLTELIDDLFTLSRIEGHEDVPQVEIMFDDLVAKIVDELRPLAQNKGLALYFERQANEYSVIGSPEQLKRVVVNLIGNAIRYTSKGAIHLKSSISNNMIQLEVRDSGIGIPGADLSKVFDRFYRSSNAKSTSSAGTGLGLAIAKAIVDNYGGRINVESSLNQGSIFTMELPYYVNSVNNTAS